LLEFSDIYWNKFIQEKTSGNFFGVPHPEWITDPPGRIPGAARRSNQPFHSLLTTSIEVKSINKNPGAVTPGFFKDSK
jgi:hypothetical protein